MSRFNTKRIDKSVTQNHEGAKSYKLNDELALYSSTVTSLLSDKFYEKFDDTAKSMYDLVQKCDPEFCMKLAVYAREKMHLRSMPLLLTIFVLKHISTSDSLREKYRHQMKATVTRVIQRVDEIPEIISCYLNMNSIKAKGNKSVRKLSNILKNGISDSFHKFDQYQFQKYKGNNKEISLQNAIHIVHAKPTNEAEKELFKKIADNELGAANTWEAKLSKDGQKKDKAKKESWEETIDMWITITNDKIKRVKNYMAILRNLRNILEAGVSEYHIDKVCAAISNRNAVLKSKQLPFRFFNAYRVVQDTSSVYSSKILDAIEDAVNHSVANLKGCDGNLLIASDVSGSMMHYINNGGRAIRRGFSRYDDHFQKNYDIQLYHIGLLLGNLAHNVNPQSVIGMFGNTWKPISLPSKTPVKNTIDMERREGEVGYSTYGYKVIDWALEQNQVFDKIFMFSDGQMYNSRYTHNNQISLGDSQVIESWHKYLKTKNKNAKLYIFDLGGYGTTPIRIINGQTYFIAGWSDKVFEVLESIDKGETALDEIKNVRIWE